jgi:predicted DNA-binding transcriptional regulator YafY
MPLNKNAYLRLKVIDALLSSGARYSKREILERIRDQLGVEVSPFTFDKDLQLLRYNLQAPVEYHARKGYYYSDKDFVLFRSELNEEEVEAIEFAYEALNNLGNTELAQEAQAVLMNLFGRMRKADRKGKPIIYRPNVPVKGVEWLPQLYRAIEQEQPLVMRYYKLQTKEIKTHTISPYVLRQYNDLWYVVAWSAGPELTLVYALDRIREISPANVRYYRDPAFDAEQYFRYSFGITHSYNDPPQKVRFWINKEAYYYLEARPMHPSQKVVEEKEDGFVVELEVIISEELVMALRGLGSRIRILLPSTLSENNNH